MQIGGVSGSGLGRASATETLQNSPTRDQPAVERIRQDVAAARDVARSALANERFGRMLEQIFSPALSDALMMMKDDTGRTDLRSAQQHYGEAGSD
ncbi:hypothetical protein [Mesorhizobium sp. KR1-2]|uniref:hypothetical protein n=1 Tax=Mesorhizobium sp. KR1-2 TaxID=3156609 RepID=UPI0032B404AC